MPVGVYIRKMKKIEWITDENGCHICISHSLDTDGYPQCSFNKKHMHLSRFIYESINGIQPEGVLIRHTCDNRKCINPLHLVIGLPKDNSKDMVERNRQAKGEKHGNSKLTLIQVNEIKSSSLSTYKLSKVYKVSRQNISFIRRGRTWNDSKSIQ